jgi:SPP1 gp7 family putative phage head morphogenesis protein
MADLLDRLDSMDFGDDADAIEAFMREEIYPAIFGVAYDEANGMDLPISVEFDVTDPNVKKAIDKLATRIRGVADTTKDSIRSTVSKALEGEYNEGAGRVIIPSNKEIAKRIREQGDIDSESRALTIARTETATGLNLGHTFAYEDAGVDQVEVMDGDDDEDCAAANGQIWSLDDARDNPIAHPNCTRSFAPYVTDAGGGD